MVQVGVGLQSDGADGGATGQRRGDRAAPDRHCAAIPPYGEADERHRAGHAPGSGGSKKDMAASWTYGELIAC